MQYKKGSLNLIADSLSRLRTGDHYKYDAPLHNNEPLVLKEKAEINMCCKTQGRDTVLGRSRQSVVEWQCRKLQPDLDLKFLGTDVNLSWGCYRGNF